MSIKEGNEGNSENLGKRKENGNIYENVDLCPARLAKGGEQYLALFL